MCSLCYKPLLVNDLSFVSEHRVTLFPIDNSALFVCLSKSILINIFKILNHRSNKKLSGNSTLLQIGV